MARAGAALPWATPGGARRGRRVLDRLGIADLARRHIRELSGGQQQRMFIARALLRRPQLLLHGRAHLRRRRAPAGTTCCTCSATSTPRAWRSCITTHDLNGVAAHLPQLVALHRTVIAAGHAAARSSPPPVLERTFGAPMEVLEHLGMPVVLDRYDTARGTRARTAEASA